MSKSVPQPVNRQTLFARREHSHPAGERRSRPAGSLRLGPASLFIDKMPNNFRQLLDL